MIAIEVLIAAAVKGPAVDASVYVAPQYRVWGSTMMVKVDILQNTSACSSENTGHSKA